MFSDLKMVIKLMVSFVISTVVAYRLLDIGTDMDLDFDLNLGVGSAAAFFGAQPRQ
jgi:hypothetical protein